MFPIFYYSDAWSNKMNCFWTMYIVFVSFFKSNLSFLFCLKKLIWRLSNLKRFIVIWITDHYCMILVNERSEHVLFTVLLFQGFTWVPSTQSILLRYRALTRRLAGSCPGDQTNGRAKKETHNSLSINFHNLGLPAAVINTVKLQLFWLLELSL